MNRLSEAESLLRQTIVLNPSLPLAHLDLGIVAAETGRNEEALREFKMAEEKTPDDVNVHWRLARLYRVMGKKEEAKAEFDKASTLNKKADDDLYKKIKEGSARPPGGKTPPADPASAQPSPE
jgi:tetratricopeptide (TPR) repeat protein